MPGAEIRAETQAGGGSNGVPLAAGFQVSHRRRGPDVLPDDGGRERFEGGGIPGNGGLALVGDSDGFNGVGTRTLQDLARTALYASQIWRGSCSTQPGRG